MAEIAPPVSLPVPLSVIRRSPVNPARCHLARAISLIGDRWCLMILRACLFGVRRFEDFRAELDIPRTVLSQRLTHLCSAGLLEKRTYQQSGQRRRYEYRLTPMGDGLRLSLIALTQWGDQWLNEGRSAPMILKSKRNGQVLHIALADEGGFEVKPNEQRVVYQMPGSED
jgi:DNA-binding HxlR family transcriptional regulator